MSEQNGKKLPNYTDLKKALRLACEMVADCPGAQDDWPGCGGTARKCSNDAAICWERYFLEEAGK